MKNLASIMPQTFENIEQSSLGKYSTGVPEAIQINPNLEKTAQGNDFLIKRI